MSVIAKGFSLIELMIVVAIIGILAAIGLPAYEDYILKSRFTQLTVAASEFQKKASEYRAINNTFPTALKAAGFREGPLTASDYVDSVAIIGTPTNTQIKFSVKGANLGTVETNPLLQYTGDWSVGKGTVWTCTVYSSKDGDEAALSTVVPGCTFTKTKLS